MSILSLRRITVIGPPWESSQHRRAKILYRFDILLRAVGSAGLPGKLGIGALSAMPLNGERGVSGKVMVLFASRATLLKSLWG